MQYPIGWIKNDVFKTYKYIILYTVHDYMNSKRKIRKINGYIVDGKEISLVEEDWNFLAILDACRYDLFKKVYNEFFNTGTLKKAISPSTGTPEYLVKNYTEDYDDIIYISSVPFCNSKQEIRFRADDGTLWYFDARKHFFKIIDAWDIGWSEKLGTVHPKMINRLFVKEYLNHPDKRFILHYLQPHNPYITMGGKSAYGVSMEKTKAAKTHLSLIDNRQLSILKWYLRKRIFGDEIVWKIRKMLGKPPDSCETVAFYEGGRNAIKKVYMNEIKLVLEHVKMLIDSINGKWLITADHGERLGERHGWYGHIGPRDKWVTEVPFFYIENNSH